MNLAKIVSRKETRFSPWVGIVAKEVEFAPGQKTEIYHCLSQSDYIAILARTPSDLIPIVRQYRPAVQAYTWELPAGLLEEGEVPEQTCRRELKEETGLSAESITYLGSYYADTGRLENRLHAFFVKASEPDPHFVPEPGMSVDFVNMQVLERYILEGKFIHQLHFGVFTLANIKGFI
ncbi:MAG: NUDIX hydrolase [Xenococcaceae cyanobacterium]